MGCRPSRSSLGRVADCTSEYNRCYLKEFDKARRKQKKSTRGGRRRTPTYNAFSSTTKCYERDRGASKITVRLSTDGSMLEIEQYDIEYTSAENFMSESRSTGEDRGIEMKPVVGQSASYDSILKKRFSYGRSDSAPVLKMDSFTAQSVEVTGCDSGHRGSNFSEDSITGSVSPTERIGDRYSVGVEVSNTYNRMPGVSECRELVISDNVYDLGNNPHTVGEDETSNECSHLSVELHKNIPQRLQRSHPGIYSERALISFRNPTVEQFGVARGANETDHEPAVHRQSTTPSVEYCELRYLNQNLDTHISSKTQQAVDKYDGCAKINYPFIEAGFHSKQTVNEKTEKYFKNSSMEKSVPKSCPGTVGSEWSHDHPFFIPGSEEDNVMKVIAGEWRTNMAPQKRELNKTQTVSDQLPTYCLICEKDKLNNADTYINNKCQTFVSPELKNCGTDSNANVCCSRRQAIDLLRKSSNASAQDQRNKRADKSSEKCECSGQENRKIYCCKDNSENKVSLANSSESIQYGSKLSVQYETNRNYPRKEENRIIADIDFPESKLCCDSLGQQTRAAREPVDVFSNTVHCRQCTTKPVNSFLRNEHHMKFVPENTYSARETSQMKYDEFKSVTMVTNDVSETTLRNEEHYTRPQCISSIETAEFYRKSVIHDNEITEKLEDEIYHDACTCQRCTNVSNTSRCHGFSTGIGSDDNIPKCNRNIGVIRGNEVIHTEDAHDTRDNVWQHKPRPLNACGDDDCYNNEDSDSSDFKDEEYVDAMETSYV